MTQNKSVVALIGLAVPSQPAWALKFAQNPVTLPDACAKLSDLLANLLI